MSRSLSPLEAKLILHLEWGKQAVVTIEEVMAILGCSCGHARHPVRPSLQVSGACPAVGLPGGSPAITLGITDPRGSTGWRRPEHSVPGSIGLMGDRGQLRC